MQREREGARGWVGGVLMCRSGRPVLGHTSPGAFIDASKLQCLSQLEAVLAEYKAENERLNEELEILEVERKASMDRVPSEEVQRMREEKEGLEEGMFLSLPSYPHTN